MTAPGRVIAAPGLLTRHWAGEDTGVVYAPGIARTHWVSADALALLQACTQQADGIDSEDSRWAQDTIDGLLEAGLLQRQP